MNVVHMFNSLHTKPSYNPILISALNAQIDSSLDVRVYHVPSNVNNVADSVSRDNFSLARHFDPNLTILSFTPPRDALENLQQ
jgi:hypothetical protein